MSMAQTRTPQIAPKIAPQIQQKQRSKDGTQAGTPPIASNNKDLYVGICFLALGSLILSFCTITFVTKFNGCAECTSSYQKQQYVLNVLYILLVVQILMQIALFVTAMCMVWGIIREVRLTYGIYIGFAFMMLLLDAIILGMVNQSAELKSIRSRFKNNQTMIGFKTCIGIQVGIRSVSIILSFVLMFKEGVMAILKDPTVRRAMQTSTTIAAAINPATAPAGLAANVLPMALSASGMMKGGGDLTAVSKLFTR